jgi:1-deoxy-D-xylulose-5-phosphate reductoisomerase
MPHHLQPPRRIVLLGATGSIGTQTLDVVQRLGPERARIVGLSAHSNIPLLASQARAFSAAYASVTDGSLRGELVAALSGADTTVGGGEDALTSLASLPEADTVVVAVAGAAGLAATLAACKAGKRVCIATKEVLVAAGALVMATARENGAEILPIDSEHSAVFQCLHGYSSDQISHIHLTASGGPFRTWTKAQIAAATRADALKHPTWTMGGKITIDSATLMNKGLEVIEARWLFDVPLEKVSVVVHPQSVVHSFVEMQDGALLAQLGLPDMRLPIQIALTYPEKPDTGLPRLNPTEIGGLSFERPDEDRFPALTLARHAGNMGGVAPAVLNAANEAAVGLFLEEKIGFGDICRLVELALDAHGSDSGGDTLESILDADKKARLLVTSRAKIASLKASP